jgi:mono/diheme cytochrome c family protein
LEIIYPLYFRQSAGRTTWRLARCDQHFAGDSITMIGSPNQEGGDMRKLLAVPLAVVLLGVLYAAGTPAHYELKQKHVLGGEGGWDYLTFDPLGKRLFISRGTSVMVVDPAKGKLIATIPDTPGVHGIALARTLGKGFTSNGRENTVTVFDLKTLKQTAKIKLEGAENPDAILYDAASKRVFTFNGRSKNASIIDAVKGTVVGTIPLDGKPEFAAADGKGTVFVNIEDKSELTSIDAKKGSVVKTWPLAPCEEPSGLAIDAVHRRLFAGCHNKMMAVVDADSGKVIATPAIGQGVDANAFDPGTQLAFSSNGDGTLTVVHQDSPDKYTVLEDAPTQRFARTMALDPATHNVYLVTAEIEEAPPEKEGERPRRSVKPGTFTLLVMSPARAGRGAASAKGTTPGKATSADDTAMSPKTAGTPAPAPSSSQSAAPAKPVTPAESPASAKPAASAGAATAVSAEVKELYRSKCQVCHAADGSGSTAGKSLGAKDFHSLEVSGQSDAALIEAITKGKNKMPSYGGKLTDGQIKDLVGYIRSLK